MPVVRNFANPQNNATFAKWNNLVYKRNNYAL